MSGMKNSIKGVKNGLARGGKHQNQFNSHTIYFCHRVSSLEKPLQSCAPAVSFSEWETGALRNRGSSEVVLEPRCPGFQSADIHLVNVESCLGFNGRFVQHLTQHLPGVNWAWWTEEAWGRMHLWSPVAGGLNDHVATCAVGNSSGN